VGDDETVALGVKEGESVGIGVIVADVVGTFEGDGVGVMLIAGVGVWVGVETILHEGTVTTSLSSVTAPVRASARPSSEAPVVSVIETEANTDPFNRELDPSVADDPTSQYTLHA
jgi:hypothetical protein